MSCKNVEECVESLLSEKIFNVAVTGVNRSTFIRELVSRLDVEFRQGKASTIYVDCGNEGPLGNSSELVLLDINATGEHNALYMITYAQTMIIERNKKIKKEKSYYGRFEKNGLMLPVFIFLEDVTGEMLKSDFVLRAFRRVEELSYCGIHIIISSKDSDAVCEVFGKTKYMHLCS